MKALMLNMDRAFAGNRSTRVLGAGAPDGTAFPKENAPHTGHLLWPRRGDRRGRGTITNARVPSKRSRRRGAPAQRPGETVAAIGYRGRDARPVLPPATSVRVTELAVAMAHKLTLEEKLVNALRLASDVHDIGKIAVRQNSSAKPGRLSTTEFGDHQDSSARWLRHPQVDRVRWPIALTVSPSRAAGRLRLPRWG